jgi:DNA-directed RNA polymerase subunit M/transcription elongation factor TFIIS
MDVNTQDQGPDEWQSVGGKCRRCGAEDQVVFKVRETDSGHSDDEYHCQACGATWFVDGIDS